MILDLYISQETSKKILEKHDVIKDEIEECFFNRAKGLLADEREQHKTHPPTMWFIAETNMERLLKIVFIELSNGRYEIKTAYEPNQNEVRIYEKHA